MDLRTLDQTAIPTTVHYDSVGRRGSVVAGELRCARLTLTISELERIAIASQGLSYTLAFLGLSLSSVTVETLIWSTENLMVLVLAWIFLGEQFGA
jgi:hypothetical protein